MTSFVALDRRQPCNSIKRVKTITADCYLLFSHFLVRHDPIKHSQTFRFFGASYLAFTMMTNNFSFLETIGIFSVFFFFNIFMLARLFQCAGRGSVSASRDNKPRRNSLIKRSLGRRSNNNPAGQYGLSDSDRYYEIKFIHDGWIFINSGAGAWIILRSGFVQSNAGFLSGNITRN